MQVFVDLGSISRSIVAKQCNQLLSLFDVMNVFWSAQGGIDSGTKLQGLGFTPIQ